MCRKTLSGLGPPCSATLVVRLQRSTTGLMGSVLGSSDPAVTISLGVEKKTIDSEPANSFALTVRQANEAARSCHQIVMNY